MLETTDKCLATDTENFYYTAGQEDPTNAYNSASIPIQLTA
jgi:hypothetical protein